MRKENYTNRKLPKVLTVKVIILLLALLPQQSMAQVNLLLNGGFELGQAPGTFSSTATYGAWTANNASWTALLGMPYVGMPAQEGTNAMHIGNSRNPGSVSQTFATTIGANYEVSLWVRGWPNEVGNGTIKVFNGGTIDLNSSFSSAGTNVWTQRQFTFTASGTSTTIELKNVPSAATNIDNVSVTAAGCPAPIAICKDITVYLDGSGNATINASQVNNGSTSNCGIASMSVSPSTFNCSNISNSCSSFALDFDGSNYVEVPDNNSIDLTNQFTLEAWINPATGGAFYGVISKPRSAGGTGYAIQYHEGDKMVGFAFNTGQVGGNFALFSAPGSVPLGTWTHVAGTYDGSTMKLYVNGNLVGQAPASGSLQNSAIPFFIGREGIGGRFFHGKIDEARVWNQARTSSDISGSMNSCLSGSESGLRAYYPFNEGTGNSTADQQSGHINNGLLVNNPAWIGGAPALSGTTGGTTTTLTVIDVNGNASTCIANVTVVDNQAPTIICPADITGVIATSAAGAVVNYTAPVGTDNCLGATTVLLSGPASGATFPIGTTTVTYEVTDAATNTAQCSFDVTVVGVAPQISCPANIIENNTPGTCGSIVSFNATDIVGIPASVITYSIAPGSVFNVGTVSVTATATNALGTSSCTFDVTVVDNEAPATPTLADVTGECTATATAPTTTDNCSGTITGTPNVTFPITAQGTTVVTWTFDDGNGNTSQQTQTVIVDDITAPVPDVATLPIINAVCSVTLTAPTASDNCSGTITGTTGQMTFDVPGNYSVTWTYDDGNGNTTTQNQTVNIAAVTVDANASSIPVPIDTAILLKATISPMTAGVTIEFFVDGVSKGTATTNGSGYAQLNIGTLPLEVYEVIAKALPSCGQSAPAYLPVYDPNGNFVTGGGWISSPAGAYTANPDATGKANFGFVSKYKKGTNEVNGNTGFQFHAGDLNFKSTLHEAGTLIISTGNRKATYRGDGTVNGVPGYKFTITAIDGQFNNGTGPDRFRIKIWSSGGVVYDNQMGNADNSDDATVLGGGSIVIHEAGKKAAEMITQATEADKLEIRVANNPAQGGTAFKVQVVSNDTQAPINLRMLDMRGQPVEMHRNLQSGATFEFGSRFTPGMYLIEALQGNKRVISKVLKQ